VRPARANGAPAVALYRRPVPGHRGASWDAVGVSVLSLRAGRIAEITSFMDGRLLPWFDLPLSLPAA
jgi:hypothetical protein